MAGSSRFLNTIYATDLNVSGTTSFASLDVSGNIVANGTLNIGSSTAANAIIYLNGKKAIAGTDGWLRINEENKFASGVYFGTNLVRTDGSIQVGASGSKINMGTAYARFNVPIYMNNSGNTYKWTTDGNIVVNNVNATTATLGATTITNGKATTLDVSTLNVTHQNIEHVANLGGTFLVTPTVKCISSGSNPTLTSFSVATTSASRENSENVNVTYNYKLTIADTAFTTATIGTITWTQYSEVKVSGTIDGTVLGTCNGYIESIETGNTHRVVINIKYDGTGSLSTPSDITTVDGLTIMLTNIWVNGTEYDPIGIWMKSADSDGRSHISLYGGTTTDPVVRIGNLVGLPKVNGRSPEGWGIYTNHGYFDGVIVSNYGKIGNFTITDALYSIAKSFGSTANNVYIGDDGISLGTTFKVTKEGAMTSTSGNIAAFQIDATALHTANVAITSNADNSIALSHADFTRTVAGASRTGLRFAIGDKFGVTGDGILYGSSVNLTGAINATSGTIGSNATSGNRWQIGDKAIYNTTNSMTSTGVGTYVGVDGIRNYKDANTYVNIQNGVITAKAVNLTGEITAISGIIGGASIVDGVLQVTDANISGEISANHINASGLTIAQSQVTNLTTDLNSKASTASVNNLKAVYGTSSTAAATATKVVTCSNFALYTGALITVRFSAANTVDGLKLNVNGTGAKDVFLHGVLTKVGNSLLWGAKALVTFRYDGTRFLVMDEPSSWYGTCTTADSTAAKVASQYNTNQGCVIMPGTKVIIAMTNANTASNTTLNFNGTGAKSVYADNANPTVANGKGWPAGSTVEFVFDGQYWYIGNTAAAKTATNYIVADSNGLMVADMSNGVQTPTTATSKNVLIDDDSVDIRNGQTVLATFGNTVRIGRADQGHVDIDATNMYLRGYNNIKIFHVGEATVWTPDVNDLDDVSDYTCTSSDVGRTDPLRFEVTDQAIHYIRVLYNGEELYGDGIVPIESEESSTGSVRNFLVIRPQDVNDGAGFSEGDVVEVGVLLNAGLYLGSTKNGEIAPGAISHGLENTVTGSNAYASGNRCIASGNSSHAEGVPALDTETGNLTYVTASGLASHAEGVGCTSSSQGSHSEGFRSVASGWSSHAEGNSIASGDVSHAEGYESQALGNVSHAGGRGTIAKGACQTVIGQYNKVYGSETVFDYTKPVFIIGNGTNDTDRSNALTVSGNGNILVGNTHKVPCVLPWTFENQTAAASTRGTLRNLSASGLPSSATVLAVCVTSTPNRHWIWASAYANSDHTIGINYVNEYNGAISGSFSVLIFYTL